MLNPVLRNSMLPEHRLVYDMKLRLQDEALQERIVTSVKHIRKVNRRNGVNKLEAKLDKYGNKGGWYIERCKKLAKKLYEEKTIPKDKDSLGRWRSIEFELVFKSPEACEEFTHAVRGIGLSNFVTIKNDDSIRLNPYDVMGVRHEVILSYRSGDEDSVRRFCKCLKGRAYVNASCGTHFHIDMRHLTEDKVTEYGTRIAQAVPALRLLLPLERRGNKHCKEIINTTKTQCVKCGRLSCNCHVQPHKYTFVNLAAYNKYKTIEIRGHSGTINADKILNWIKLCETIMLAPFTAPMQITTIEDLIERYRLDKELTAYVKERFAKFNETTDYWANQFSKTEGEENPTDHVEVLVPASLISIPPAKNAQVAPKPVVGAVAMPAGGFANVFIVGQ